MVDAVVAVVMVLWRWRVVSAAVLVVVVMAEVGGRCSRTRSDRRSSLDEPYFCVL